MANGRVLHNLHPLRGRKHDPTPGKFAVDITSDSLRKTLSPITLNLRTESNYQRAPDNEGFNKTLVQMQELLKKPESKEFVLNKKKPSLPRGSPQPKAKSKQTKLLVDIDNFGLSFKNKGLTSPGTVTSSSLTRRNLEQAIKAKREFLTLMSRKRANSPEV